MRILIAFAAVTLMTGCIQQRPQAPAPQAPLPQQPLPPQQPQQPQVPVQIGGTWTITAVELNGVLTNNPGPSSMGITFGGATREFNANLGCNSAQGPYTQNGNALDFGAIAVTERACFAPAPLEGPLLAAFDRVQTIAATPSGFDLLDGSGRPLIRMVR